MRAATLTKKLNSHLKHGKSIPQVYVESKELKRGIMKKFIITTAILFVSSFSFAAKLETSDLIGRLYVVDQKENIINGVFELFKQDIGSGNLGNSFTFNGIINKKQLDCNGTANFVDQGQYLVAHVSCSKNTRGTFLINFKNSNIGHFLDGGLIDVNVSYTQQSGTDSRQTLINKTVDGKKLD